MNRPTPISAFSDQRRTKSTTRSRTSCGTQLPVRVPQDFLLARCAQPSAQPGPRFWSAPSSPRTRSVSAFPPLDGGDAPETEKRRLRSRTVPSASGRTPLAAGPVLHTAPRRVLCPMPPQDGYFFFWSEMLPYVRSVILTEERFLQFQLRRDKSCRPSSRM